ncbi:Uncharacterised protein [Mycobacteroides abscessus subsp. abscessus]|nr:Uncharacterised protein [Mycobacteroides abscessus subsp. abscessus]
MVGRVGAVVHESAVRVRGPLGEIADNHDSGRPDLTFDVSVLVKPPVGEVFVVGDGYMERHGKPAHPAYLGAVIMVDVFPQDSVVLFVDADRVLDGVWLTLAVVQHGIQIPDLAQAVAAQLQ